MLHLVLERPVGDAQHQAALEHERHGFGRDIFGNERALARLLVRGAVRTVAGHYIVQACAGGLEAVGFGVVVPADETWAVV